MSLLLSKRCFHARINLGQLLKCWLSYCWREYLCYNVLTRRTRSKSWIYKFSLKDFAGLTIRKLKNSCQETQECLADSPAMVPLSWCAAPQDVSVSSTWIILLYARFQYSAFDWQPFITTWTLTLHTDMQPVITQKLLIDPPRNGTSPWGRCLMQEHKMLPTLPYI